MTSVRERERVNISTGIVVVCQPFVIVLLYFGNIWFPLWLIFLFRVGHIAYCLFVSLSRSSSLDKVPGY